MKSRFLFAFLLLAGLLSAEEKRISVLELNQIKIAGELGHPLHTLCEIEAVVVFMPAGSKGLAPYLTPTKVNGKKPVTFRSFRIPEGLIKGEPVKGASYHFWGYETVGSIGYPREAFDKLGIERFPTDELQFLPKLVVLKLLGEKPPEAAP